MHKTMRCTRVEKFLPLYVAGDLSGRRVERHVKKHLAACERCRGAAADYDASRALLRAATLLPDFDGAFYEQLRRSVLAEIERGRPGLAAPLPLAGFASLFNARFAYAASLALIVAIVGALSLQSYVGRKFEEEAQRNMIADVNDARTGTPSATPVPTQATTGDEQPSSAPFKEAAEQTASRGARASKPLPPSVQRHANHDQAGSATQRSVDVAERAPERAGRNPLALPERATAENPEEIARTGGATHEVTEVSRIEIQTSDPNIRIIWLSPKPDAVAQPLK